MRPRSPLGMILFLVNEAVLFFLLIVGYVYFRSPAFSAPARNLNVTAAAVFTACLLASSFTMWRVAETGARSWLGVTLVLGAVFLYGQASEYVHLLHQNVTMATSQFGTTFFALTGLHALHVLAGLILLGGFLTVQSARSGAALQSIALYWYFVDAVWLVIFSVVYLWTFV